MAIWNDLGSIGRPIAGLVGVLVVSITAMAGDEGDCVAGVDPSIGQPGMNSSVFALTTYDDGTGEALYAGGFFTMAGGSSAARLARWDGKTWQDVGGGLGGPGAASVRALLVIDDGDHDSLIVGGNFIQAGKTTVKNVAKWDGTDWSSLGDELIHRVRDLEIFDDGTGPAIYAATDIGNEPGGVWKFDGKAWSVVGAGIDTPLGMVLALEVFDDGSGPRLIAGGIFGFAGDQDGCCIAQWDGKSWSPVGIGVNEGVYSLKSFDDGNGPALFAGGTFLEAGGIPAINAARWDGSQWSNLGNEDPQDFFGIIFAMAIFDYGEGPALYLTGADGFGPEPIFQWTGGPSWNVVTDELIGSVMAITPFDDGNGPALYVGGGLLEAGGEAVGFIARWTDCPLNTPGDLDGDGVVGASDLLILLVNWGPCDDCDDCPADLDDNCTVGASDLLILLVNWG
ncbi:MAG: hypothetical protein V3T84_15925 [Phycisphaerales bacterium]